MAVSGARTVARLADVARAAGVSNGTVSNVFNRPEVVREEVRSHVREVARTLGYAGPDPKGRLLRAGKVNAIGVATVEPLSHFFDDPFARVLMRGITEACDEHGVGISLVSARGEEDLAWSIRNAVVDGFILFCLEGADRLISSSRERHLPFVALDVGHKDKTISVVSVDNVVGGRLAAEHLCGLGHRRFAIVTMEIGVGNAGRVSLADVKASPFSAARDRVVGYFEAMAAHGIDTATVPIFETRNDTDRVRAVMDAMFALPEPPTAILAESDRIALAALDWLAERGIAVPGDVSIIGFDGVPESATSRPPLTTIAQPIAEIGRQAVATLLAADGAIRRTRLDVELVVRGSTAPPPG